MQINLDALEREQAALRNKLAALDALIVAYGIEPGGELSQIRPSVLRATRTHATHARNGRKKISPGMEKLVYAAIIYAIKRGYTRAPEILACIRDNNPDLRVLTIDALYGHLRHAWRRRVIAKLLRGRWGLPGTAKGKTPKATKPTKPQSANQGEAGKEKGMYATEDVQPVIAELARGGSRTAPLVAAMQKKFPLLTDSAAKYHIYLAIENKVIKAIGRGLYAQPEVTRGEAEEIKETAP